MAEPRLRSGLESRRVDGRIVVMDLASGDCVALNRTGAHLWDALVAGAGVNRLEETLLEAFSVDQATARRDVESFLAALRKRGLLEE